MRKIFILTCCIIVLFFSFSCSKKEKSAVSNIPTFTLKDLEKVLNGKHKIVLINFWATWCPTCRQEIPDLIQFYDEYKNKVTLIGLSVDESKTDVANFIKMAKINFPIYIADKNLAQHFMVQAIPVTYVFKNGKYLYRHIGDYSYSQLKADIKELLKKQN